MNVNSNADKSITNIESRFAQYDPLQSYVRIYNLKKEVSFGSGSKVKNTNDTLLPLSSSLPSSVFSASKLLAQKLKSVINRMRNQNQEHELQDQAQEANVLVEGINTTLMNKQYQTAFYKLPVVMKHVKSSSHQKPPAGLYYYNRKGRKVYLKDYQKRQWMNGDLPGCVSGCSPDEI